MAGGCGVWGNGCGMRGVNGERNRVGAYSAMLSVNMWRVRVCAGSGAISVHWVDKIIK